MKKREGDEINLTNRWSLIKEDILYFWRYMLNKDLLR